MANNPNDPKGPQNPSVMRRHHYGKINHCQNRGQFIPYHYNYNYEDEKIRVAEGKMEASQPKGTNSKHA